RAARISSDVGRVVGRERAQTNRSPELLLDEVDDSARPFSFGEREGEPAHRVDLIRANGLIRGARHVIAIDDVIEALFLFVPEALGEGDRSLCGEIVPAKGEGGCETQRVDPERLDLDGFANARSDDPVADLRVHPSDLDARRAGGEESIGVSANPKAGSPAIAFENRL